MKWVQFQWFACVVGVVALASQAHAQTAAIGLNFTGTTRGNDSTFNPPDSMGAVGPSHIVEMINGQYAVYDKAHGGTLDKRSLNDFFDAFGPGFDGPFTFDPRVIYDPFAQRWYATAVDNVGAANNIHMAVSVSANPLDGWRAFKVDSDSDDDRWADFPQLGYNADGVVVMANMFTVPGSGASGSQVSSVIVGKSDLINSATPSFTLLEDQKQNTGSSTQPTVDLDNVGGELLMFSARISSVNLNLLGVSRVIDPASATPSISSFGLINIDDFADAPNADQPGAKPNLNSGTDRIQTSVVRVGGSFWGVRSGADPVTGNAGVQWFQVDAATNFLFHQGFISESGLDLIYPSIAVNAFGDIVIGMTGSGENQFASSYAVVGKQLDPLGPVEFGDLMLLKAGVSDFERLDSQNRNRWGDYSSTVVDPSDPRRFWTFQEFVHDTDQWGVQITELIVPEPSALALLGLGGVVLASRRRRP